MSKAFYNTSANSSTEKLTKLLTGSVGLGSS